VGFARGKTTVKLVLGHAMQLTEEGWRQLSLRWGLFFLVLAALNEVVWRNFPTETWVNFKVFGLIGMSLAFSMLQMPFLKRHWLEDDSGKP
ncbi:MAG: septation protein A, partial [Proteobacteria bacterium]|nr:septation protein A [Pseudomonadota bacterium]